MGCQGCACSLFASPNKVYHSFGTSFRPSSLLSPFYNSFLSQAGYDSEFWPKVQNSIEKCKPTGMQHSKVHCGQTLPEIKLFRSRKSLQCHVSIFESHPKTHQNHKKNFRNLQNLKSKSTTATLARNCGETLQCSREIKLWNLKAPSCTIFIWKCKILKFQKLSLFLTGMRWGVVENLVETILNAPPNFMKIILLYTKPLPMIIWGSLISLVCHSDPS